MNLNKFNIKKDKWIHHRNKEKIKLIKKKNIF
jgi:hypothetical protein